MRIASPVFAAVAALLALCATGNAQAADTDSNVYANPTAFCQGALPSYEGAIRKRPLALQNEGTGTAFVTCSIPSTGRITRLSIWVAAVDEAYSIVRCTAVTGYNTGSNLASTKEVAVFGTGQKLLSWTGADFDTVGGGFPSQFISVSCSLPRKSGLNDIRLTGA